MTNPADIDDARGLDDAEAELAKAVRTLALAAPESVHEHVAVRLRLYVAAVHSALSSDTARLTEPEDKRDRFERLPTAVQCKCGQMEVPPGFDGVNWYWQRHACDACTLELPNVRCWCGLLRSEHVDGHRPDARHPGSGFVEPGSVESNPTPGSLDALWDEVNPATKAEWDAAVERHTASASTESVAAQRDRNALIERINAMRQLLLECGYDVRGMNEAVARMMEARRLQPIPANIGKHYAVAASGILGQSPEPASVEPKPLRRGAPHELDFAGRWKPRVPKVIVTNALPPDECSIVARETKTLPEMLAEASEQAKLDQARLDVVHVAVPGPHSSDDLAGVVCGRDGVEKSTTDRTKATCKDCLRLTAGAREHHLKWNGTEWVDDRCGCRYHPDDDNGSHGGAPHVHLCERHKAARRTTEIDGR